MIWAFKIYRNKRINNFFFMIYIYLFIMNILITLITKITITNKKENFTIDEKILMKENDYFNYVGVNDFCEIVMSFVYSKKGITKIQKCLSSSDNTRGDVLKEYKNLETSNNRVVLNDNDFEEVVRLMKNIRIRDTRKKEIVISSFANIIAYECNRYLIVEELEDEVDLDFIFDYVCCDCLYFYEKRKYKKEILNRVRKICKEEYNFELDEVLKGGKKNE